MASGPRKGPPLGERTLPSVPRFQGMRRQTSNYRLGIRRSTTLRRRPTLLQEPSQDLRIGPEQPPVQDVAGELKVDQGFADQNRGLTGRIPELTLGRGEDRRFDRLEVGEPRPPTVGACPAWVSTAVHCLLPDMADLDDQLEDAQYVLVHPPRVQSVLRGVPLALRRRAAGLTTHNSTLPNH